MAKKAPAYDMPKGKSGGGKKSGKAKGKKGC